MKTSSLLRSLLAAASLVPACPALAADPPAGDDALRAAAQRSLAYLEKEGETWMDKKNCNGCHHLPLQLWSHQLALTRGFTVDTKKLEEWATWADEWTPEATAPDKKGGLEEAAFRLLAMPERSPEKLVKVIAANQQPDGSWKPSGQFASMQARGPDDARANSTRLFLLALAAAKDSAPAAAEARTKAAAFLAKRQPARSVDYLVHQWLYARQFGPAEEAEAAHKQMLQLQRGDGGWSWIIGVNHSDALATGEVLYALSLAGEPADTTSLKKAQQWLVANQSPDGGWLTDIAFISKSDRSAADKAASRKNATEIYHYYGSAWASIGLLQSLPPVAATPASTP